MKVENITDKVFRFTLTPLSKWQVYAYLINADSALYVIDTGCGYNDAKYINDFIVERQFKKPIIIINTHFHYDHIWGNNFFNYKEIIASQKTYQRIIAAWEKELNENIQYKQGNVNMTLPTITFDKYLQLENSHLRLFQSKGHTDDGICIYYAPDKILFVGDNIGDDDIQIIPELENTNEEYIAAIKEMLRYDVYYVLSGHNNLKKKDFLHTILNQLSKK